MSDLPHPTTAAATTTTTTETLYDLWERSRQPPPPHDQHWHPAVTESLPWSNSSTTGISFLDAALSWGRSDDSISPSSSSRMPTTTTILDITGDAGTGKTSTLLTYAARFLAQTRRRRVCPPSDSESTIRPSPMVILFDNHRNVIHPARSVYDKLYAMIQQQQEEELSSKTTEMNRHDKENHSDNNMTMVVVVDDDKNVDTFVHGEVMECLQRLHIARVEDFSQWVLLLETLRHELFCSPVSPTTTSPPPAATILLLWDDFLDDDVMLTVSKFSTTRRRSELAAVAMRMDVIRQLERLLDSGGPMVTLVTTTTTTTTGTTTHHNNHNHNNKKRTIGPEWNRCVTHSIHLERTVASSSVGSSTTADFLGAATITTQQHHHHHHSTSTLPPPIPFVISQAHGIVS